MSRRRPARIKFPPPRSITRLRQQEPSFFLLDQFSLEDIKRWTTHRDKILRYHWEYYSSLAYQRSRVTDDIQAALQEASCGPFEFKGWQRIVKYKYSLDPLSVAGSLSDIGGRFNIGDIDPSRFPPFPALYIASDASTALQETFGKDRPLPQEFTPLELALTQSKSISNISINGTLGSVINVNKHQSLQKFIDIIKNFVLPGHLEQEAKKEKWEPPTLVRNVSLLLDALLFSDWRKWAMLYDVPVASQIFGQLAANAGIEGIIYPSKYTKKDCLAIFPQNFENDSHILIADETPPEIHHRRLDEKTWREINR